MQRPHPKGSSTDIAFLKFIEDVCDLKYEEIQQNYNISHKFPFNSARKRMSTIIDLSTFSCKKLRLVTKGASEIILESCTKFHTLQDEIMDLTPLLKEDILNATEKMANLSLRPLVLAYKDLDQNESF